MELPPLSAEDLELPNEKLGWWLVSTWVGHHAQRAGFPLDAIPPEWATRLIEETAKMDSDSVANASLESIFRKACAGSMESAGRMLREYLHTGAVAIVTGKYADVGIKQTVGRKKGGQKAAASKKADAASWHKSCEQKALALLAQGKKRRDLAGILAPQFSVTARQVRAVLKKTEVK